MGACCTKNSIADESAVLGSGQNSNKADKSAPEIIKVRSLRLNASADDADGNNEGNGQAVGGWLADGKGIIGENNTSNANNATNGQKTKGSAGTADNTLFETVKSASSVKVAAVVRPLMDFEKAKGAKDIVSLTPPAKLRMPGKPNGQVTDPDAHTFEFDRVYSANVPTCDLALYEECVRPVVERFCQGFNGCVLAYGQTGSGKTYTMGSTANLEMITGAAADVAAAKGAKPKAVHRGVIPRAVAAVFRYLEESKKDYESSLRVIYVEIYNEALQDLLESHGKGGHHAKKGAAKLEIRERPDGEVYVEGVVEAEVANVAELAKILEEGNASRAVGAHKMNEHSSRSHAILCLMLEQHARPAALSSGSVSPEFRYLRSKLQLVDLAGSERAKETGATGQQFAEGININKGLLELGNVVNALVEKRFVPYRNSKLTRALQDSLGGNSETLFIACASPASVNHDQTLGTLKYATRARSIKNQLKLNNKLSTEEELAYLRNRVAELTKENQELLARLGAAGKA